MAEPEGMETELEQTKNFEETPSYLVNAASAAKTSNLQTVSNNAVNQNDAEVDEFGLPAVPVRNLA